MVSKTAELQSAEDARLSVSSPLPTRPLLETWNQSPTLTSFLEWKYKPGGCATTAHRKWKVILILQIEGIYLEFLKLCIFVCLLLRVHMHADIYTEARGHLCALFFSLPYSLEAGSFIVPCPTLITNQSSSPVLLSLSPAVPEVTVNTWLCPTLLRGQWGFELRSSWLWSKCSYPLGHHPGHCYCFESGFTMDLRLLPLCTLRDAGTRPSGVEWLFWTVRMWTLNTNKRAQNWLSLSFSACRFAEIGINSFVFLKSQPGAAVASMPSLLRWTRRTDSFPLSCFCPGPLSQQQEVYLMYPVVSCISLEMWSLNLGPP